MKKALHLLLPIVLIAASSCSTETPAGFVLVESGIYKEVPIADMYIAKHEVTQQEWRTVMGVNPSQFKGNDLPVEMVSWYDCIEYCNARSLSEKLSPCYIIDKKQKSGANGYDMDDVKWSVTLNATANGYRLPTEVEWEYAARGGQLSKSYSYSGSSNIEEVAWYWKNSGDRYLTQDWSWALLVKNKNGPKPVGQKKPNELGLYDMSGNVREWCWDWHEGSSMEDPSGRTWKGGGWIGADFCCQPSFKASHQANGKGPDQGFRVCRSR